MSIKHLPVVELQKRIAGVEKAVRQHRLLEQEAMAKLGRWAVSELRGGLNSAKGEQLRHEARDMRRELQRLQDSLDELRQMLQHRQSITDPNGGGDTT